MPNTLLNLQLQEEQHVSCKALGSTHVVASFIPCTQQRRCARLECGGLELERERAPTEALARHVLCQRIGQLAALRPDRRAG